MTRQKKEIIKKIDEIDRFIQADMELGAGFAPADAYSELEEESGRLYEELAHLRHYKDGMEMMYDTRGYDPAADPDIPFN